MPKRAPHPRQDEHAERTAHRHTPAHPWLLYAVVFMCGAILMALEIVGSRMLAPYFGNSIFVWGASSASFWRRSVWGTGSAGSWRTAGRAFGPGRAHRHPWRDHRASAIRVSGSESRHRGERHGVAPRPARFLPSPVPGPERVPGNGLALRRAAAGAGGGLGGVDGGRPVRRFHRGKHPGNPDHGVYLIAVLGVANIVHALGLALLLVAAGILLGRRRVAQAGLTLLCAALLLAGMIWHVRTQAAEAGLILEADSFYNHIRLAEDGEQRYMDFENLRQSAMSLKDPWELRLRYTRFLSLALTLQADPNASRFLV